MAQPPIRGVTAEQERQNIPYTRDVRRLGQRMAAAMEEPLIVAGALGLSAFAVIALPGLVWLSPLVASALLLAHLPKRRPLCLPSRLPQSANRTDYNDRKPGGKGHFKARGIAFLGNAVEEGNQEVWRAKLDELTHKLVIGTTGAGKTVMLVGEAANYLSMGGGLIYVDAKAAPSLLGEIISLARRVGREDDFLAINYMTGNAAVDMKSGARLTNTANPLAVGSGDSNVQMMSSLIPTPEGDNAVFGERALNMLTGALYALGDLRDGGHLDMGVSTLRDYLPLEKYEELAYDPRLRTQAAKAATMAYLKSLPNWKSPADRAAAGKKGQPEPIADEANRQHGFAQMYFTRALSSLTDTYGHIYSGVQGEVDSIDVVRQRRILVVMLPALEKAPAELQNLGKINLSSLRDAISSGLGSKIEGTRQDVLESLPTASHIPSKIICDEYGYMAVEGFAIVAAQARGLGFSVTFAGQDWAGIKRGSEKEAEQIWSNCKVKVFGTLLDNDTVQRLQAAVGEAAVTETAGFDMPGMGVGGYADNLKAAVSRRSRVDVRDLANQTEGEAHVLLAGDLVRTRMFYTDLKMTPTLQINRYLRVGEKLVGDRDSMPAPIERTQPLAPATGNGPVRPPIERERRPPPPPRRPPPARVDPAETLTEDAEAAAFAASILPPDDWAPPTKAPPVAPPVQQQTPARTQRPPLPDDEHDDVMLSIALNSPTSAGGLPTPPPSAVRDVTISDLLRDAGFEDDDKVAAAKAEVLRDVDFADTPVALGSVDSLNDLTLDDALLGERAEPEAIAAIEESLKQYPDPELVERGKTVSIERLTADLHEALDIFLGLRG